MGMNERVENELDCTDADIVQLGDELKRLWVSHRGGEVAARKIINLIALLIQSARTRIILLRTPPILPAVTLSTLQQLVLFHTFRYEAVLQQYLQGLVERVQVNHAWLQQKTVTFSNSHYSFNISLVRIHPQTAHHTEAWFWEGKESAGLKTSYQRVHRLVQHLRDKEPQVLDWVLSCFNDTPIVKMLRVPTTSHQPNNVIFPVQPSAIRLLQPVHDWVERAYQEYRDIPLLQVAGTSPSKPLVDYGNLFFFVRLPTQMSTPSETSVLSENIAVGLIVPELQQREFSQFFHRERKRACQWYEGKGKCRIPRIHQCLFNATWQHLRADETDVQKVHEYFTKEHWQHLNHYQTGKPTLAGAAFKTQTIVFERRQWEQSHPSADGQFHVSGQADQILHCIKCRLVPNTHSPQYSDDCMPQVMFTPIYSSSQPLLTVATVVNAKRPELLQTSLTEWQQAVQWAGFVYRYLANRFKEHIRKGYLGAARSMVTDCYLEASEQKDKTPQAMAEYFIDEVNSRLEKLSKIYSYPKIYLSLESVSVINNDIRDDQSNRLIIPWLYQFKFSINVWPETYWQQPSGKQLFSRDDVIRKFQTAIHRAIAYEQLERLIRLGEFQSKPDDWSFD